MYWSKCDPLLANIIGLQILSILSTEDSSALLCCKSCQRWAPLVTNLVQTFQSSSSHISSVGFKSADCTSQDISWRMCYSSLLLMYLRQSLLVCIGSLSCMSTNPFYPQAVFYRGSCDAVVCCDSLIQFALHLMQIPDFRIRKSSSHHNRSSSMLYGWYDTGVCSSFANFLLYMDPPISLKDFELWFISPKDFIPLLYCLVCLCLGLLTLFCFVFSTVVFWQKFCHIGQLHSLLLTHFFHDIGSVVQWFLEQSTFCHARWWRWWSCPLHRWNGLYLASSNSTQYNLIWV